MLTITKAIKQKYRLILPYLQSATDYGFGNPPSRQGDISVIRHLFCTLKACGDGSVDDEMCFGGQ